MINIYFDTEFTGLFKNAALISIGLCNEKTGSIFYAECSDNYTSEQCSDFCKKTVLPLLDEQFSIPLDKLKSDLFQWLKKQSEKEDVILLSDAQNDIEQFNQLFPKGIDRVRCHKMGWLFNFKRKLIKDSVYKEHHLRHHHSLDDALANKIIALRSFLKIF